MHANRILLKNVFTTLEIQILDENPNFGWILKGLKAIYFEAVCSLQMRLHYAHVSILLLCD